MDIDKIYEKAKAATPGPWWATTGDAWDADGNPVPQASIETAEGCLTWDDHSGEVFKPEDADYIAEANPKAIMELIDALREARENEVQCSGMCLTGSDVGVYGSGIAYPHDSCPKHGDPVAFGIKGDALLDGYRARIAELETEIILLNIKAAQAQMGRTPHSGTPNVSDAEIKTTNKSAEEIADQEDY